MISPRLLDNKIVGVQIIFAPTSMCYAKSSVSLRNREIPSLILLPRLSASYFNISTIYLTDSNEIDSNELLELGRDSLDDLIVN